MCFVGYGFKAKMFSYSHSSQNESRTIPDNSIYTPLGKLVVSLKF